MKPTLVDNCEHYNRTTHACDKCGRGLPDVCLEYENLKRKAEAYEKLTNHAQFKKAEEAIQESSDRSVSHLPLGTEQAQEPKKTRGRPRKVNVETNDTN